MIHSENCASHNSELECLASHCLLLVVTSWHWKFDSFQLAWETSGRLETNSSRCVDLSPFLQPPKSQFNQDWSLFLLVEFFFKSRLTLWGFFPVSGEKPSNGWVVPERRGRVSWDQIGDWERCALGVHQRWWHGNSPELRPAEIRSPHHGNETDSV